MALTERLSKILYGAMFCLLLPALLYGWSQGVSVNLPIGHWQIAGWIICASSIAIILWGMFSLRKFGNGLPMNAFPPAHFVARGPYRWTAHPIYVGFCAGCIGASFILRSPSMLYLISPTVVIGSWALVAGFEGPDLKRRFGKTGHYPFIGVPEDSLAPASIAERAGVLVLIFGLWAVAYESLLYIGVGENFIDTTLPFERNWPVIPLAEIPYTFALFYISLTSLFTKTRGQLRRFTMNGLWAIAIGSFLQLLFPFYAAARPITSSGWLSDLMKLDRLVDGPAVAFPSYHVIWAWVVTMTYIEVFPKQKPVWIVLAILISWSCSAVGVHTIADIVSGFIVFLIVAYRAVIWQYLHNMTQSLANSWNSMTIGNFRIINHSLYAGLAGFAGVAIVTQFVGDVRITITVTASTLAGGAIWGQWLEGSGRMLRPFGYYGAILGGITGVFISAFVFSVDWQIILAAFAMASPWTQAIGRLRCLVQGCCHGKIREVGVGIIYTNEHSRVCKISGLQGKTLHNTPLYSIASNVITGLVLWRIWYGGAGPMMITGLYFILNGAARFVEEHYRGEIQTKVISGLRLYQWIAIGSIILGAAITTLDHGVELVYQPAWSWTDLAAMSLAGLASAFAMGMDFPQSNVPFSRLTG